MDTANRLMDKFGRNVYHELFSRCSWFFSNDKTAYIKISDISDNFIYVIAQNKRSSTFRPSREWINDSEIMMILKALSDHRTPILDFKSCINVVKLVANDLDKKEYLKDIEFRLKVLEDALWTDALPRIQALELPEKKS